MKPYGFAAFLNYAYVIIIIYPGKINYYVIFLIKVSSTILELCKSNYVIIVIL
jgi:hypothetical protein